MSVCRRARRLAWPAAPTARPRLRSRAYRQAPRRDTFGRMGRGWSRLRGARRPIQTSSCGCRRCRDSGWTCLGAAAGSCAIDGLWFACRGNRRGCGRGRGRMCSQLGRWRWSRWWRGVDGLGIRLLQGRVSLGECVKTVGLFMCAYPLLKSIRVRER